MNSRIRFKRGFTQCLKHLRILQELGLILVAALSCLSADGTPRLNTVFSDHMVLQKGMKVPVWGTADNGEQVTVSFNGQRASTIAKNGVWKVMLKPMNYLFNPGVLSVFGKDTITVNDVLVGEVWICSGQSNMERQLGPRPPQQPVTDWEKERDEACYPLIREFYVPLKYSSTPVHDVNSRWTVCSPASVSDFSAVGYFFARKLYESLGVPVGIIFSAFGGTVAEDWMSYEVLVGNPRLSDLVNNYQATMKGWYPEGKVMNGLYNGMIYPLTPYAVKGVAWYQGEQNVDRPRQYVDIMKSLIEGWRNDFRNRKMPFLIVQIAPYKYMTPDIREAQLQVSREVKRTVLIVTTDCGDANDIHPPLKRPVGDRLGCAALGVAYRWKITYEGPKYRSYKIKNGIVRLTFDNVGSGLVASDGAILRGFTIAGFNGDFVEADAVIKNSKVEVSSSTVTSPVAVRYGWQNVPLVNLSNREGLPASPFRTDHP